MGLRALKQMVGGPIVRVGLVMSLALLGDALLYVALPARAEELGLPLWAVGILLGANRIVRLLTNAGAAWLFARFGARGPVIGASVASAGTTAMYALTPAFVPLLMARLLWGACFSTLRLGSLTVVLAASDPSNRGRLIGLYQSISRGGPVLSLLLGGLAIETLGYHRTFAVLSIISLGAVPLALSLRRAAYGPAAEIVSSIDESPSAGSGPFRNRLGGSRLVAVKLGMLANGFAAQGVVLSTVVLALSSAAGTSEGAAALAGVLVGLRWAFDLALAGPLGYLSDRLGRGRLIPVLLVAQSLTVAGLALASDRAGIILATLLIFLAATALTAAGDAAAGDLAPPDRRPQVMSGYATWVDIGSALGPFAALLLAESLGLRVSYGLTGVLLVLTAVFFVLAWRREQTMSSREPAQRA